MLQLKNIAKGFARRELFSGLDLDFKPGELVSITGANGTGKSTFFKLISGEEACDAGTICLNDSEITHSSTYERSFYLTQVKQNPLENVFTGLTVFQNMVLAERRGARKRFCFYHLKARKKVFFDLLKQYDLGLESFLDEVVDILSGGQKQALALIMAILAESKIILLDEHCSALDPSMTQKVMALTRRIVKEYQLIALMITHDTACVGDSTLKW